jgi:hypothetical protein
MFYKSSQVFAVSRLAFCAVAEVNDADVECGFSLGTLITSEDVKRSTIIAEKLGKGHGQEAQRWLRLPKSLPDE